MKTGLRRIPRVFILFVHSQAMQAKMTGFIRAEREFLQTEVNGKYGRTRGELFFGFNE